MSENHIIDNSSLHTYRTEIPNIIFTLGLTPYELTLYCFFKKVAGDGGYCTFSNKEIAARTGMGESSLKKYRKTLEKPRTELGGKCLITVEERKKENGTYDTSYITINDVWIENMEFCSQNKKKKLRDMGGSPHDRGVGRHATQGGSPRDHKQKPYNNNQKDNVPPKPPKPKSHPPKRKKDIAPPTPKGEEETLPSQTSWDRTLFEPLIKKYKLTETQQDSLAYLNEQLIDTNEGTLCWWAKNYPIERLRECINYARKMNPDNLGRYINSLLINKTVINEKNILTNRESINLFKEIYGNSSFEITKKYVTIFLPSGSTVDLQLTMNPDEFSQCVQKYLGDLVGD